MKLKTLAIVWGLIVFAFSAWTFILRRAYRSRMWFERMYYRPRHGFGGWYHRMARG